MNQKHKIFIGIIIVLLVIVGGWAGLTKAGHIPNFLNIEILCPENNNNFGGKIYYDRDGSYYDRGGSDMPPINTPMYKPVIYLYPTEKQDILVQFNYEGKFIAEYPKYDQSIKGWRVTAYPDGRIINRADNREYSYLFWEGVSDKIVDWDLSTGFVVKGEDTREFLQKVLAEMGLAPKEYNEFIVYWYPLMKDNQYNLIHFADKQYTDMAQLNVTPSPDSTLRVFMVFKPLTQKIDIEEQKIPLFERKGFTVIEWGGTEIK
ncbi:MAG: hypothetical protein WC520_02040 [Candidatus Paceibacterota bacterium]